MAKTFSRLKTEGRAYLDTVTALTVAQREEWQRLVDTGKAGDAALFVAKALHAQYSTTTAAVIANTAANRDQRQALYTGRIAADEYGRTIEPIADGEKRVTDATQAMSHAFDEAGERARALMNASDVTAAHLRQDAEAIVSSVDKLSSGAKKIDADMATVKMQMAASLGDPKAMQEFQETYRRLTQMRLENSQKRADPIHLDRDALKQDEDALKHFDDTSRASNETRLTGHIAMLKQMLGAEQLTDAQRHQLQQDFESSQKQLFDSQTKLGEKSAKDVLGANEAAIQGQIAHLEAQTQHTLAQLDMQVKLKEITEDKKAALAIAALKREEQAVDALFAKELALAGLSLTQKQQITDKAQAYDDRAAKEVFAEQAKAAEASAKAWDAATKTINSAFDSQIGGLLHGTTSWEQASKNVLATLTEDTLKYFLNRGMLYTENLAKHAAMNLGILASDTSTQAAATGAHAAGAAAQKAIDTTTIVGDAARAAAGAYAAVAGVPVIGPALAPAAAAVAYGGALAFNSFDIGAWNVPQDQLAMIHRNELVMPAAEAGALRSMLSGAAHGGDGQSGGGTSVGVSPSAHFHISAMDSRDVERALRGNQTGVMKVINQAVRDGAHLGLRRIAR